MKKTKIPVDNSRTNWIFAHFCPDGIERKNVMIKINYDFKIKEKLCDNFNETRSKTVIMIIIIY